MIGLVSLHLGVLAASQQLLAAPPSDRSKACSFINPPNLKNMCGILGSPNWPCRLLPHLTEIGLSFRLVCSASEMKRFCACCCRIYTYRIGRLRPGVITELMQSLCLVDGWGVSVNICGQAGRVRKNLDNLYP